MIGKLYSAIHHGLQARKFRVRIHTNNYSEIPPPHCWKLRFFGCLSYEEDTLGAQLNRRDRYQVFRLLWTRINQQVCA